MGKAQKLEEKTQKPEGAAAAAPQQSPSPPPAAAMAVVQPHGVRFLAGDVAVVIDKSGMQLTAFSGTHAEVVAALERENIDWKTLPERWGKPELERAGKLGGLNGREEPWDGKAPRDASGSFTVAPEAVTISIPMLELLGPKGQTPYRAYEISIKASRFSADPLAQEAIRFVQDAMSVTNAGVAGKSNPSAADAVLFVFHLLGAARREALKPAVGKGEKP